MGFNINRINTTLNQKLTEDDEIERVNQKPTLEFYDEIQCPNNDKCQYKIVDVLDTDTGAFTTGHLDTLDCLFYTI